MVTPKYTKQFEEFWRQYPNGPRDNSNQKTRGYKPRAWKVWKRMSMEERFAAMDAVQKLKRDPYIPQASVWLNGTGWDCGDEVDWEKRVTGMYRDIQRQTDRETYKKYVTGLPDAERQEYLVKHPFHKWLVDEIEKEFSDSS